MQPNHEGNLAAATCGSTEPISESDPHPHPHPDNNRAATVTVAAQAGHSHSDQNPLDEFLHYTISEPYRYFLLVVGSVGCFIASFCYTFALFAQAMTVAARMDMSALTSAATVMLVFSYFTLPYAYLFDVFGPKPVLIVGTVLLPLGCLLMALTFRGTIPPTTVNFCVFLGIMGGGCIVFDIGTVVSVLSWFPTYKGPVVAIMKTFAGLGSAIVACLEYAFFEENVENLMLFMMACAIVLGLFCIFSMQLPPYHLTRHQEKHLSEDQKQARHRTKQLFLEQRPPRLRMVIGLGFVVFLMLYLPIQSTAVAYATKLSHGTKVGLAVVVIVALALYPMICLPIPVLGGMEPGYRLTISELERRALCDDVANDESFPVEDSGVQEKVDERETARREEDEMEEELDFIAPQFQTTFLQSLLTFRLWAIFCACFAIIGAQLVILFHYPYICAALRGKPTNAKFKALLGALSGVGSAFGRLLLSWLENYTQSKPPEKRKPITVVLFVPAAASLLGLVLYLALPGDGVAAAHFVMAIGNGSAAAAAVLVFRAIFAKEPALHYNFGFLSAMVSAVVLNRVVYGEWFLHEFNKSTTKKINPYCLQKSCVLMPLLLMLGLNALSFIAVTYVHVDYARYVKRVVTARDKHREERNERRERRRREMGLVSGGESTKLEQRTSTESGEEEEASPTHPPHAAAPTQEACVDNSASNNDRK